jgi:hypothetical protein
MRRSRQSSTINPGQALAAVMNLPAAILTSALQGLAQSASCAGSRRPESHSKSACTSACMSTDIKWIAQEGEVRIASILIENNQAQPATIKLQAAPWTNSDGVEVTGGDLMLLPASLSLKAGEAATVRARAHVVAPLQPGLAYYTEIQLIGCPKRTISVGLGVHPQDRNDLFISCSPCCGSRSRFLEVCKDCGCEPCDCECGACDPCRECGCCASCCRCEPCATWPGCWDPHGHWLDDCEVFYLPPRQSTIVAPYPGGLAGK